MEDNIIKSFYEESSKLNFDVKGLITCNNEIISLGSDSKLIGRILNYYQKRY